MLFFGVCVESWIGTGDQSKSCSKNAQNVISVILHGVQQTHINFQLKQSILELYKCY